jgi:hypothetical protein
MLSAGLEEELGYRARRRHHAPRKEPQPMPRPINFALPAMLLLAACASEPSEELDPSEDPRVGELVPNLCFSRAINAFSDWDRGDGVVLRRGVDDRFLVTFIGPCFPAEDAQAVGIGNGFAGSGCIGQGDQLFFSRSASGTINATPFDQGFCRIGAIYAFEADPGTEDGETQDNEAE